MLIFIILKPNTPQTYNVGHKGKLTGLVTSAGATFTSSGDKSIRVLEPTRDPAPMATINVHRKEVAKVNNKYILFLLVVGHMLNKN